MPTFAPRRQNLAEADSPVPDRETEVTPVSQEGRAATGSATSLGYTRNATLALRYIARDGVVLCHRAFFTSAADETAQATSMSLTSKATLSSTNVSDRPTKMIDSPPPKFSTASPSALAVMYGSIESGTAGL